MSLTNRYPQLQKKLRDAVLEAPGTADATLRRAAHSGEGLAEPLNGYVDKLRRHAYRAEDGDIETLRAAGYSEDEIFEVTVAAALGAGDERLRAGLSALDEALR